MRAKTERHAFGILPGTPFPTPRFSAPKVSCCGNIEHGKPVPKGCCIPQHAFDSPWVLTKFVGSPFVRDVIQSCDIMVSSFIQEFTPKQRCLMDKRIGEIYEDFVADVAAGRKLSVEEVGEFFTRFSFIVLEATCFGCLVSRHFGHGNGAAASDNLNAIRCARPDRPQGKDTLDVKTITATKTATKTETVPPVLVLVAARSCDVRERFVLLTPGSQGGERSRLDGPTGARQGPGGRVGWAQQRYRHRQVGQLFMSHCIPWPYSTAMCYDCIEGRSSWLVGHAPHE